MLTFAEVQVNFRFVLGQVKGSKSGACLLWFLHTKNSVQARAKLWKEEFSPPNKITEIQEIPGMPFSVLYENHFGWQYKKALTITVDLFKTNMRTFLLFALLGQNTLHGLIDYRCSLLPVRSGIFTSAPPLLHSILLLRHTLCLLQSYIFLPTQFKEAIPCWSTPSNHWGLYLPPLLSDSDPHRGQSLISVPFINPIICNIHPNSLTPNALN